MTPTSKEKRPAASVSQLVTMTVSILAMTITLASLVFGGGKVMAAISYNTQAIQEWAEVSQENAKDIQKMKEWKAGHDECFSMMLKSLEENKKEHKEIQAELKTLSQGVQKVLYHIETNK